MEDLALEGLARGEGSRERPPGRPNKVVPTWAPRGLLSQFSYRYTPPLRVTNFNGFHGYDNRYNLKVLKSKVRFNFFENLKWAVDAF